MIVHKNWVINSLLSGLTVLTCLICDKKLSATNEPQIVRAFYDNITHGLVGLFTAAILFTDDWDRMYWAIICMLLSSAIDVDHFISARSLRLSDATNLQSRPFLHNSMIPLVLIFFLIYCHFFSSPTSSLSTQNINSVIMILTILIIAFTTHQFRDAHRRGLTFMPFYQTPPLSYLLYIGLILITPYFFKIFIVNDFKYRRLASNTSQKQIFEV